MERYISRRQNPAYHRQTSKEISKAKIKVGRNHDDEWFLDEDPNHNTKPPLISTEPLAREAGLYSGCAQRIQPPMRENYVLDINNDVREFSRDAAAYVATQARKAKNEVSYRKLGLEDQTRMKGATKKEADSWLTGKAVGAITAGVRLARLLTWIRDQAEPDGKKVETRLVVLGLADPDIERLRSEAPGASWRARQYFLALSASCGWRPYNADAVTIFLQGPDGGLTSLFFEPTEGCRGSLRNGFR